MTGRDRSLIRKWPRHNLEKSVRYLTGNGRPKGQNELYQQHYLERKKKYFELLWSGALVVTAQPTETTPTPPSSGDRILTEDGSFMLTESGGYILKE